MNCNLTNIIKYFVYRTKIGVYTIFSNKNLLFSNLCKNKIHITINDLSYFTLSANTITVIKTGESGELFFREVLPHNKKEDYFLERIQRFCVFSEKGIAKINFEREFPIQTKFARSYINDFSGWIEQRMKSPLFFRSIEKCDYVLRREKFSIWEKAHQKVSDQSLREMGLSGLYDKFPDISPLFLSYLGGSADCYRVNRYNKWETFYAQKSMASYEVAKLLGKSSLLTIAQPTELITDSGSIFGVLSPKAKGLRGQDYKDTITPFHQRDLATLWIIDLLCCQPDHAPNNYNVIPHDCIEKKQLFSSICAFDNDNMFTFFPVFNIKKYNAKFCSKLISADGLINLPHLDKAFGEVILNTSIQDLSHSLLPFLNRIQMLAFKSRYKGLQKALKKTMTSNTGFLITDDEWSNSTIEEELSGKYGKTYLSLLIDYQNHKYD